MSWLKHGELNKQIFILNQNDNKEIKIHEPTRKNRMKIKQQQTMLTHFYEQEKKKCEDATKQKAEYQGPKEWCAQNSRMCLQ